MHLIQTMTFRLNQIREQLQLHEDWRLMLATASLMTAAALSMADMVSLPYPGVAFGTAILGTFISVRLKNSYSLAIAIVSVFLVGLSVSEYRKAALPDQTIERETFVTLSGNVVSVDYQVTGPNRLVIEVENIDKQDWLISRKIRLSVRTTIPEDLLAGTKIEVRAVLGSSNGRLVPGGFDFDLHNRFSGIAAQGFAVSDVVVHSLPESGADWRATLENWRSKLADKVLTHLEQPVGGIAVALITGQRQFLDKQSAQALRDAGLAHLLAISGLHMGLITGVAFLAMEILLAALLPINFPWPPRKPAAIFAWLMGLAYLFLSGMGVSTLRAFTMVSIAILAVLSDRRVISLRSVSIAAFIVLLVSPEAVFSIGFQMSFAATIGIVLAYEAYSGAYDSDNAQLGTWFQKGVKYILATAATSFVAQLAIAPIALYHFQTLSIIALVANFLAVPLMAFLIMPAAFLALVLSVIGFEGLALYPMGLGLSIILEMSQFLSSFSFSVLRAGPYPPHILVIASMLFVAMMVLKHRLIPALAVLFGSLALLLFQQKPAGILIYSGGKIIASNTKGQMNIIGG